MLEFMSEMFAAERNSRLLSTGSKAAQQLVPPGSTLLAEFCKDGGVVDQCADRLQDNIVSEQSPLAKQEMFGSNDALSLNRAVSLRAYSSFERRVQKHMKRPNSIFGLQRAHHCLSFEPVPIGTPYRNYALPPSELDRNTCRNYCYY